jgi:hypothetical protein
LRAVEYVCAQVEKADKSTLKVPTTDGTQIQFKMGPFVDACLAFRFLADVHGRLPDEKSERRVTASLAKLVAKFEANQRADGSWALWPHAAASSPVDLTLIVEALWLAREGGLLVNEMALRNAQDHILERMAAGPTRQQSPDGRRIASMTPAAGPADNTIDLSAMAGFLGTLQNAQQNFQERLRRLRAVQDSPNATDAERAAAQAEMEKLTPTDKKYEATVDTILKNLSNPMLVQYLDRSDNGGGDEYLSFVLVNQSLGARGGKAWEDWRDHVTRRVLRQQRGDGSWAAQHGIGGVNFCTPAALLVLEADPALRKEIADLTAAAAKKESK